MSNTELWDKLSAMDRRYAKPFKRPGGFAGTDINPTWRMKRLTEQFGPCGTGWGWTIHERWREEFAVSRKDEADKPRSYVFVMLSLWYVIDGERRETGPQIGGSESGFAPDEAYKMSVTDALGKCCQSLGIAAEVYLGEFDSKYNRGREAAPRGQAQLGGTGSDPQVLASVQGMIPRIDSDAKADRAGEYVERKTKEGKLTEKDAVQLHALIVKKQATLNGEPV